MYGALRPSQSLADLTSDSRQRHHGPDVRQRSGSSAALLDIPAGAGSPAGPKRFSTPNLTELAARISRAERSKLQRFGGGNRDDSSNRIQHPPSQDLNRDDGGHARLNTLGMEASQAHRHGDTISPNNASSSPPADYGEDEGQFFEPSSRSRVEAARSSAHSSVSSGLELDIGQNLSTTASPDRSRANSFPDVTSSGVGSDNSHRAVPSQYDHDSGFQTTGSGLRRGSDDTGLQGSRLLHVTPSLPELLGGKQRLRPADDRRRPPSPGKRGAEERNSSPDRPAAHSADLKGHRFCRSLADVTAVGSAAGSPPLPPPRPARMVSKRFSVPDVLEAGGEDLRRELALSELYRRRMTAGDIMEAIPCHSRSSSDNLSVDSFRDSPSRQSFHSDDSLSRTPPPPLAGSQYADTSSSRSSSLRRVALETLTLTNSNSSNHSDNSGSNNGSISCSSSNNPSCSSNSNASSSSSSGSRRRSGSTVPFISITEHEGPGPLHSPESDYPLNDLSPTSTGPQHHPQGLSPQPPASSCAGSDQHIYKTVSETTTASYNIRCKGDGGLDDTRSTNTDGGAEEGLTKDDPGFW